VRVISTGAVAEDALKWNIFAARERRLVFLLSFLVLKIFGLAKITFAASGSESVVFSIFRGLPFSVAVRVQPLSQVQQFT
jgi:hypothetical protein